VERTTQVVGSRNLQGSVKKTCPYFVLNGESLSLQGREDVKRYINRNKVFISHTDEHCIEIDETKTRIFCRRIRQWVLKNIHLAAASIASLVAITPILSSNNQPATGQQTKNRTEQVEQQEKGSPQPHSGTTILSIFVSGAET
jgi:hypothetical protein